MLLVGVGCSESSTAEGSTTTEATATKTDSAINPTTQTEEVVIPTPTIEVAVVVTEEPQPVVAPTQTHEPQNPGDPVGAFRALTQRESEREVVNATVTPGSTPTPQRTRIVITQPCQGCSNVPRLSQVVFEGDASRYLICWDGAKEPLDENINYYEDTPALLRYLFGRCEPLTPNFVLNDVGGWAILVPGSHQPMLFFTVVPE